VILDESLWYKTNTDVGCELGKKAIVGFKLQVTAMLGFHSSAKTQFPSLDVCSIWYAETQKYEIEVSQKYGIVLLVQSVH